jgi:hypothetical protein
MTARNLAGPTSRRPCRRADLKEASNQQCPVSEDTRKVLKDVSTEEVVKDVVVEVAMSGLVDDVAKNPLILNVWSVETPRYPAWLQGV